MFKPTNAAQALLRVAGMIEQEQRPSLGAVTHDIRGILAVLETRGQESPEGAPACPVGQILAHLQKWLHGKYAIDIAYRSFADRVKGPWRDALVDHWHEHAKEERQHAYDLAMRISGFGGDPAQAVVQVPPCTANLEGFFRTLTAMEQESVMLGREAVRLSGDALALKVMAENIVLVDTQHLDDLRRMSVKFELP